MSHPLTTAFAALVLVLCVALLVLNILGNRTVLAIVGSVFLVIAWANILWLTIRLRREGLNGTSPSRAAR